MRREFTLTLVALALLALTACSVETEVTPPNPSQGNEISFSNVSTRADKTDLQRDGFGVWAFIDNNTVDNYVLMDNQKVTYKDGVWTYSPQKYWIKNTEFTFMATYPYDSDRDNFTADTANKAIKLAVSETPSQVDYLVAENVTNTSVDGYNTTVPLQFKHMLTSVTLNIWRDGGKHQNDQMRITKVTLSNIRKNGSYSSATDMWTYGDDKLTVEMVNTTLSDSDNIGAATNNNGSLQTGGNPVNPFGTMMLLPQTLDSSNLVSLKIEYQLKRQNAASWETAELEAVLPTITWIAGQQYTYNVVLSSVTDITVYYIQTKVDPWGTPQVGGTVIIK